MSLQYTNFGTSCTYYYCSAQVDSAFQPPWDGKYEYQPYAGVKIQMTMGECLAYSSLEADPKAKFAAWPMSWKPPDTD